MTNKKPTCMRYQRVYTFLSAEPALKKHLSDATQPAMKPNSEKALFPKEVITITDRIHESGKDAQQMTRNDIVKLSMDYLKIGKSKAKDSEPAPAADPTPEVITPVTSKAAEVTQKPAPVRTEATPVAPLAVQPSLGDMLSPLPDAAAEAVVATPKAPQMTNGEKEFYQNVFCPQVTIYSMLVSALMLAQNKDRLAGFEDRLKRINCLIDDYSKITVINYPARA